MAVCRWVFENLVPSHHTSQALCCHSQKWLSGRLGWLVCCFHSYYSPRESARGAVPILSKEAGGITSWIWSLLECTWVILFCFCPKLKKKKNHTIIISEPFKIVWKSWIRIGFGIFFLCSCTSSNPSLDGVPNQSVISTWLLWSRKMGEAHSHPSVTDCGPSLCLQKWLDFSPLLSE